MPIIAEIAINNLSTMVKGLGFSSSDFLSLFSDSTFPSSVFFFLSPMFPNRGLENQNCMVPKSINTPAKPNPQLQPMRSAK